MRGPGQKCYEIVFLESELLNYEYALELEFKVETAVELDDFTDYLSFEMTYGAVTELKYGCDYAYPYVGPDLC